MSEVELVEGATAVVLDRGDVLVVRLAENATTGYVWQVEAGEALTVVDDRSGPGGAAPGSGGHRVVRLSADRAGTWPLVLRLGRPWEDGPVDERRVDVTVG